MLKRLKIVDKLITSTDKVPFFPSISSNIDIAIATGALIPIRRADLISDNEDGKRLRIAIVIRGMMISLNMEILYASASLKIVSKYLDARYEPKTIIASGVLQDVNISKLSLKIAGSSIGKMNKIKPTKRAIVAGFLMTFEKLISFLSPLMRYMPYVHMKSVDVTIKTVI